MTVKHLQKPELKKNCIISTTPDIKLEKKKKKIKFHNTFFCLSNSIM